MAHIVFATLGSFGDLHPVIALALELKRRGHRAEIATSAFYREKISALGLGFHPLRPEVAPNDDVLVRRIMDTARGTEFLLRDLVMPALRDTHADLAATARGADLLVASELIYSAPLLARRDGVRWVSYSLAPLSYFSTHDPCVVPTAVSGEWMHRLPPPVVRVTNAIAHLVTHSWWRPLRELRREHGLPPGASPFFAGKHSPRLDLALFSPVLQSPQPDWPASTVQTGFCFYDEVDPVAPLPPAVAEFLAAGEPPVVFTLGSAAVLAADNFYAEAARAAQSLGRRALLLLGNNPPPPDLPPSVLAWDYLPYAQIFPRAAAIVHQGGVGTTAQALRAGRPMVVMPFAHDQPDNAARVTRLGIARTLRRRRFNATILAQVLSDLFTDGRAAQLAADIGARVQAERGVAVACDTLERQLA